MNTEIIQELIKEIVNKYEKFISNIEWHIKTNKPEGKELDKCQQRLADIAPALADIKQIALLIKSTAPVGVMEWIDADDITKEKLIEILKIVSLIDLSDCYFEFDKDGEIAWCNAMKEGNVVDAITYDGNLFKMMDNNFDFHPLNPMKSAYDILYNHAV